MTNLFLLARHVLVNLFRAGGQMAEAREVSLRFGALCCLLLGSVIASRTAYAQQAPPIQWKRSLDFTSPGLCTDTTHSRDWNYCVVGTRDGGYITCGYVGGIFNAGGCQPSQPCVPVRALICKVDPNGRPIWTHVRPETGTGFDVYARYREVVELASDSGYVAVGTRGRQGNGSLLFTRINPDGSTYEAPLIAGVQAYSIRQILTLDATGQAVGHGFVVGGTRTTTVGTTTVSVLCVLRLDADGQEVPGTRLTFGPTTTLTVIARPIYSGGTRAAATATLPAHSPIGSVSGFALTGSFKPTGITKGDVRLLRIPELNATAVPEIIDLADRPLSAAFPISYCITPTLGEDIGTDLEQTPTGDFVLTALFNRQAQAGPVSGAYTCQPLGNPNVIDPTAPGCVYGGIATSDAYLLVFAKNFVTANQSGGSVPLPAPLADQFIGVAAGGEVIPQVEVPADGDYVVSYSVLGQEPGGAAYTSNYFALTKYDPTPTASLNLAPRWFRQFPGLVSTAGHLSSLACNFALGLGKDGSYVVGGNDGWQNHNVALVKLASDCQVNQTYDIPDGLTVTDATPPWSSSRTVRGTIRIPFGVTFTIDDSGGSPTVIEFADTYQTVDFDGLTADNPSRIVVEPGGHLILQGDVRLTGLPASACAATAKASLWDGIVVQGAPDLLRPRFQGKMTANNGGAALGVYSVLENARYGVLAGRPSYHGALLSKPDGTEGNGILNLTHTRFLNCYGDVYAAPGSLVVSGSVTPYPPVTQAFYSTFTECEFLTDAPLVDPTYNPNAWIDRAPVLSLARVHVYLNGARAYFYGSRFQLNDGTSGLPTASAGQRGIGLMAINTMPSIGPSVNQTNSRFENLDLGVVATNYKFAFSARITKTDFIHTAGGISLSGVVNPVIKTNTFSVGRGQDELPYGIALYNCAGLGTVTQNSFWSAGAGAQPCALARGIVVTLSDGPDPGSIRPNTLYQNYFRNLSTGILAQDGNQGLQLQCNSFLGNTDSLDFAQPLPAGQISEADVAVKLKSENQQYYLAQEQGKCSQSRPQDAANNVFSKTCQTNPQATAALDFLLVGTVADPTINYHHLNDTEFLPLCFNPANLTDINCFQGGGYAAACLPNRYGRPAKTEGELLAELPTITEQKERGALLDELLSRYLTESTYVEQGLGKAVTLLQQVQEPAFAEEKYGLEKLYYGTRVHRPAPTGGRAPERAATAQTATAARTIRVGGYFAEVDDLLTPLGSDSAITATLRADSTLRQRLEAIAHDTTTWGYVAGQAALTRYLGYQFRPWYATGSAAFGLRNGPQAAPAAAAHLAAFARAYPSPTTGAVQVDYHLPDAQASGQLLVYDPLGHLLRTVALTDHTGTVALDLTALPAGLYFYTVQARGQLVAKGKLVKQF